MKLLVTGGAGFIGANFVSYWMERHPKDHVTVLDKLTYAASLERLNGCSDSPNFLFIKGDICDSKFVEESLKGIDTVVHFAAESHVDRSLSGLEAEKTFFRVNVEGTCALLHAAKKAGIKRFHHVSTDEVFGDLAFDDPARFDEDYPYSPNNPYSISKAAADFAVRAFHRTHGLPITISNCSNNYGPYQTPEKMIPRSLMLLLEGQQIQLYTDADGNPGKNVRDWLHVADHCSAIEAILLSGRVGETYAVGADGELSNHELVGKMLEVASGLTGREFSFEKSVRFVKDRPGHDRRYAIDSSKIRNELGWSPSYNFETGFLSTLQWYISDEGRQWLSSLANTSNEVRTEQGSSYQVQP